MLYVCIIYLKHRHIHMESTAQSECQVTYGYITVGVGYESKTLP